MTRGALKLRKCSGSDSESPKNNEEFRIGHGEHWNFSLNFFDPPLNFTELATKN